MQTRDFYPGRGAEQTTAQRTLPSTGAPLEKVMQPGMPSATAVAIIGLLAFAFVFGKIAERG